MIDSQQLNQEVKLPVSDSYFTISEKAQGLYKEKGSRFISLAYPVEDKDQVKEIISSVKKEFFDARHHTYAYILGYDSLDFRINDDGEPSGTAGRPIYGQLQSMKLTQVLLVVVRYFGGIKLGTSGLIAAYKAAAQECLNAAIIVEKPVLCYVSVYCGYDKLSLAMRAIKEAKAHSILPTMEKDCRIDIQVSKSNLPTVLALNQEYGIRAIICSRAAWAKPCCE